MGWQTQPPVSAAPSSNWPPATVASWQGDPGRSLLDSGIQESNAVKSAEANVKAGRHTVEQAYSRFLPRATVGADWQRVSSSEIGNSIRSEERTRDRELSVDLTIPVFASGENYYTVKQARSERLARDFDLDGTVQNVELNVIDAALSIVRDRRVVALQKSAIARLRKLERTIKAQYKGGVAARGDIAFIRSRILSDKANLETFKARLLAEKVRYEKLTGRNGDGRIPLPKTACNVPASLEETYAAALAVDPSLRAARERAKGAKYNVRATVGQYGPKVNLVGRFSKEVTWEPSDVRQREIVYGLNVQLPLNPASIPDVREKRALAEKTRYDALDTEVATRIEVGRIWHNYVGARRRKQEIGSQIAQLREAVRGFQKQFDAGFVSVSDLANAERDKIAAEINLATVKYEFAIARLRLLSLANGGLSACTD